MLALYSVYLFHPPGVSATGKIGTQVGSNNLAHQPLAYDPFAEAQHVGIVVLSGTPGTERVMTYSSPDSGHFVSDNRHANAGAANQNATNKVLLRYCLSYGPRDVRIIHRVAIEAAEILVAMP